MTLPGLSAIRPPRTTEPRELLLWQKRLDNTIKTHLFDGWPLIADTGAVETGALMKGSDTTIEMTKQWVVKLDSNGHIAGLNLMLDGVTGSSSFIVMADIFKVVNPSAPLDIQVPFEVGYVDGVTTVSIKGQLIQDGTIIAKAIKADEVFTQDLYIGSTKFHLDGPNVKINIQDNQGTPQTRVELGKLGAGTTDYGLRLKDSSGNTTLEASDTMKQKYMKLDETWFLKQTLPPRWPFGSTDDGTAWIHCYFDGQIFMGTKYGANTIYIAQLYNDGALNNDLTSVTTPSAIESFGFITSGGEGSYKTNYCYNIAGTGLYYGQWNTDTWAAALSPTLVENEASRTHTDVRVCAGANSSTETAVFFISGGEVWCGLITNSTGAWSVGPTKLTDHASDTPTAGAVISLGKAAGGRYGDPSYKDLYYVGYTVQHSGVDTYRTVVARDNSGLSVEENFEIGQESAFRDAIVIGPDGVYSGQNMHGDTRIALKTVQTAGFGYTYKFRIYDYLGDAVGNLDATFPRVPTEISTATAHFNGASAFTREFGLLRQYRSTYRDSSYKALCVAKYRLLSVSDASIGDILTQLSM